MTATGSFAKRSSIRCRTGRTCMQLMQQYVQKSRTATRPRRSLATLNGRCVLIQVNPGRNSGQRTLAVGIEEIYTRARGKERRLTGQVGPNPAGSPSAQSPLDLRGQPLRLALVAQRGRDRQRPAGHARDLQIVIGSQSDLHTNVKPNLADVACGRSQGPRQTEEAGGDRQAPGTRRDDRAQEADVEHPEQTSAQPAPDQEEDQRPSATEDEGEERHHKRGPDVLSGRQDEARSTFGT